MTVSTVPLMTVESPQDTYRLDLRLGIPRGRLKGALEWWLGNPGLCKSLDRHPYLILLEIDSSRTSDAERIMHTVQHITDESGPIQILISLIEEIPREEASLYQVVPSSGLNDFVLLLSRAFPVIVNYGTLASSIYEGTSGSFMAYHPVRLRDAARSRFITPKLEGRNVSLQDREGQNLAYCGPSAANKTIPVDIFRIVLRKNDIPLAEYDLVRKEWLSPKQSSSGRIARSAIRTFRIQSGFQMSAPGHSKERNLFVISDLHLGHANSIPRYKRPFFPGDVREMDRVLIRNWNWTVKGTDTIFYLGDLSYMSETRPEEYLRQLGGNIIYVEGNHDPAIPDMPHCVLMRYRDVPYLMIHDPDDIVKPFPGWIVYGHVHNKDLAEHPFFDPAKRRINVSAEMVGYRPISFDEIHHFVTNTRVTREFRDLS